MSDPDLSSADGSDAGAEPLEPLARGFQQLEDVIADESFPDVDLALRRGRHIHKGDERWYEFLLEAQGQLEAFYRRYGCELEQRSDGYFFLLPVTESLGKRHLGVAEMIVGQGLALCYLDPQSVQSGGLVTREELLNQLAAVMGTDALMRSLNPKRKRADERVMQRTVRNKVNDALRRLAQLGFVELLDGEQLRLAPSLMRFAEPVRGLDAPSEALKRLIERGEISLGPGDADDPDPDVDVDLDVDLGENPATSLDAAGLGDPRDPTAHEAPEETDARRRPAEPASAPAPDADAAYADDPYADDSGADDPGVQAREESLGDLDDARDVSGVLPAAEVAVPLPEIDFEWDSLPGAEPSEEDPPGEEE